jgi:hypothetical protein
MPLDENDKKVIGELIGSALKANNAEIGKQFVTAEAASKMIEQNVAKLDIAGQVAKGLEKVKPKETEVETGKGTKTVDPEMAKLREQQEQLETRLREADEKRVAAEARERHQKLEAALTHELTKAGIPSERHPHVLPFLRTLATTDGKPVLDVTEQGVPVWRAQRKGYVDDLDLAAGVKEWVETSDGKTYLPPRGTAGTGDGVGGTGSGRRDSTVPRAKDGTLDLGKLGDAVFRGLGGASVE